MIFFYIFIVQPFIKTHHEKTFHIPSFKQVLKVRFMQDQRVLKMPRIIFCTAIFFACTIELNHIDMITKIPGEMWKQLQFSGHKDLRKKYAVSTVGRAASYITDVNEDGKILNGSLTSGYRTLNLHPGGGSGTIYLHREIAKHFCRKNSPKHKFVIHLNHQKEDNVYTNLKWATMAEVGSHQQQSPQKIAYKERQANKTEGLKLNVTKVKSIKEAINNPKRKLTYKQMAVKYNVSEMTLYRIRSGENWGKVQ